jgi:tRNA(Leu) C34 or U34 (ribose-2'-O)-methylase TrmL
MSRAIPFNMTFVLMLCALCQTQVCLLTPGHSLCSRFLRDAATDRWRYIDGETDWKAHDYAAENQY